MVVELGSRMRESVEKRSDNAVSRGQESEDPVGPSSSRRNVVKDRKQACAWIAVAYVVIVTAFGNAVAVRVEKQWHSYALSSRRLDGDGYDTGKLVEKKDFNLDEEDSRALDGFLLSSRFFDMPIQDDTMMSDGDNWVFEA